MRNDNGQKAAKGKMGLYNASILHLFSEHTPAYFEPWLKVFDDRMQLYFRNRKNGKPHEPTEAQLQALQKHEFTGQINKSAERKLRSVLDTWLTSLLVNLEKRTYIQGSKKYYPTFITLTLCAEQFHSDLYIKRHMLGEFIKHIIKHHHVNCYFWRAESQTNGNIHFHIIVDRYIKKEKVSEIWDNILANHGYLKLFRQKNGDKNPSATNIKGIKDVKNFVNYVLKYAFKNEDNRLINGRLWGMSDKLRTVKAYEVQCKPEQMAVFRALYDDNSNKKFLDEFFAVVFIKDGHIRKKIGGTMLEGYNRHLLAEYDSLYCNGSWAHRIPDSDLKRFCDMTTGEINTQIPLWEYYKDWFVS